MRNLALMWVLAGCLLGCGGRNVKDKAAAAVAPDTVAVLPDTATIAPDTANTVIKTDNIRYNREPVIVDGGGWPYYFKTFTGSRSKGSVKMVILRNNAHTRYAYNMLVREKPHFASGFKITVEFAIDEFGKVISTQVVESTANDTTFENTLVKMINGWVFEEIDKPGDTTVAVFPFHFSQ
jgi:TonB family protein